MPKFKLSKLAHRIMIGLPLVGVVIANLLPISIRAHQFLVGITLIWFQVFVIFEIFSPGSDA